MSEFPRIFQLAILNLALTVLEKVDVFSWLNAVCVVARSMIG